MHASDLRVLNERDVGRRRAPEHRILLVHDELLTSHSTGCNLQPEVLADCVGEADAGADKDADHGEANQARDRAGVVT